MSENGTHFYIIKCWGGVDNSAFVYKAGDSFGERALTRDKPQAIDIVVTSDVLMCFCAPPSATSS